MRTKSLQLLGRLAALGVIAVTTTWTHHAKAAQECADMPHPLVVVGSSAVKPFMQLLGAQLAKAASPITLIYQSPGSCVGQNDFFVVGTTTGIGVAVYDNTGTATTCDITTNNGTMPVDIGISDVFFDTCSSVHNLTTMPSGTADFHGPVQSMVFAVPSNSSQTIMSAEAAYLTFGLGMDGGTNWNDESHLWARSASSGTQQMIGAAIGVPAAQFKQSTDPSNDHSATAILNAFNAANLAGASIANITLGILGMDVIRKPSVPMAGNYVPLAYQHYGQTAAYYPSSDFSSNDMQNTRDGHYMIQGPVHMFASVNGSGVPTKAEAKTFINYMTGAVVPTAFDLVALEASLSIVPDCAMHVTRDAEIGPFMSYQPPISCECKFLHDSLAPVPTECGTCDPANNDSNGVNTTDCSDSSRQHCNYGYCEVQ
jgi:ABC-type phosphate transport system substrate-binding protein